MNRFLLLSLFVCVLVVNAGKEAPKRDIPSKNVKKKTKSLTTDCSTVNLEDCECDPEKYPTATDCPCYCIECGPGEYESISYICGEVGHCEMVDGSCEEVPTPEPTPEPTKSPTQEPTDTPTHKPTDDPTRSPTDEPTADPTHKPTEDPTRSPTPDPTDVPTRSPTDEPTSAPTHKPTDDPTRNPTHKPTDDPTEDPTESPTPQPTRSPTDEPTRDPTHRPTDDPTKTPTKSPTPEPTDEPTEQPTRDPTHRPTADPTRSPTPKPTQHPSETPTESPTNEPTKKPTKSPTPQPTDEPTRDPTHKPTADPTRNPTHKPTDDPTRSPTDEPTNNPTVKPTKSPTPKPTESPTPAPTAYPSASPTDESSEETPSPTMKSAAKWAMLHPQYEGNEGELLWSIYYGDFSDDKRFDEFRKAGKFDTSGLAKIILEEERQDMIRGKPQYKADDIKMMQTAIKSRNVRKTAPNAHWGDEVGDSIENQSILAADTSAINNNHNSYMKWLIIIILLVGCVYWFKFMRGDVKVKQFANTVSTKVEQLTDYKLGYVESDGAKPLLAQ